MLRINSINLSLSGIVLLLKKGPTITGEYKLLNQGIGLKLFFLY